MANVVLMPKVGISVDICLIGTWRKKEGDRVKMGEILFDYETDKTSLECESTAEGTLLEIFYGDGDEVPVLTAVCAIGEPGENVSVLRGGLSSGPGDSVDPKAASQASVAEAARPVAGDSRIKASPRARNLAERLALDVKDAVPTGPHGRVTARDIETLDQLKRDEEPSVAPTPPDGATEAKAAPRSSAPAPVAAPQADYTDAKLPLIRVSIAKAMTASLLNMAQLTNHHSCDAARIMEMRSQFKQNGAAFGLDGISIGDMVLFATVKTLIECPYMNAHLMGNIIRHFSGVHLGVAVDTPRGLMVPTIFNADKKTLLEISREVHALAASARSGNINPDLLSGATFTVSNLGATGVEIFTPIINPPQVGILGVCGITTRVRDKCGGLEAYPSLGLSLTYDHRAIDGAPASRFAQALCGNLEQFHFLLAR
jgi:pyruvate dehydrogenase E2 component (dihydrolipoamide acetyltransferase)